MITLNRINIALLAKERVLHFQLASHANNLSTKKLKLEVVAFLILEPRYESRLPFFSFALSKSTFLSRRAELNVRFV